MALSAGFYLGDRVGHDRREQQDDLVQNKKQSEDDGVLGEIGKQRLQQASDQRTVRLRVAAVRDVR